MSPFDLAAYLARIGCERPPRPSLDALRALVAGHTARIPFENLDVLLGRPVRLGVEHVVDKLVHRRRGGYCFEHATLFGAVLDALGFDVARHAARVVLYAPRHAMPRTHMFLVVTLPEGRFVVDPGFGGHAPRAPVALTDAVEASFVADAHRMARDGDHWTLRARVAGADVDCWTSALEETYAVDFEMANHFTATHPASAFVNRLMLRAFTDEGSVSAMNRDVKIVERTTTRTLRLANRSALRTLIAERLGFDEPAVERLVVPSIPEWR